MGILDKIRSFLKTKSEAEIQNFKDELIKEYDFREFLLVTIEGLPIMGTFHNSEELSAKVPEFLKFVSDFEDSTYYILSTGNSTYILVRISEDVLLFAKGERLLRYHEVQELKRKTKNELGI